MFVILKPVFFTSVFFLLFSFFTSVTYAHVLKSDGQIGAVLHVNPDDDPVAGEPTGFFFEFKDKENKFTPQSCECTFSITKDGNLIYSVPLFKDNSSPSLTSPSIFYTFYEKGIYQVKVAGGPTNDGTFSPFTLVYDIRVAREAASAAPVNSVTQSERSGDNVDSAILLFGGGLALVLIFLIVLKIAKGGVKNENK